MGCTLSGSSYKKGGIRLMSTKLAFSKDQLTNLNGYFRKLVEDARRENDLPYVREIEVTVERLIQRLMLGAASLDRRFSSMFLVSLNEPRRTKELKFEYLVRIDALSTPLVSSEMETIASIEEDSAVPGFVRVKIRDAGVESWHEYVDAGGRLRRDSVKGKLANLLATAIKREVTNCVDDKICISPGQVVDAEVLHEILKQPDYCRVFYGSAASDGSLPEPRNHRIALIEDALGILLKIELEGQKTRDIEVRLLIGIGVSSWSNLADYPRRVPLHHCDALLHYNAAQSGMYAVAVGPYTGARCEDRATLWRTRVPAAEKIMNQHYADDSVPSMTDSVLMEILYKLREGSALNSPTKAKDRLRVVSRHILRTMHRWSLERAGPDPLTSWAPETLSRHVILVLDETIRALQGQNLRCYFHPRCNVMLQCARGGTLHREDTYASDARLLESYLTTVHRRSLSMTVGVPRPVDVMESELVVKWRGIMASLPRGTMNADYGYNQRQLEYFSLILEEVLAARAASLQDYPDNGSYTNFPELPHRMNEHTENLLFLLKLVLTQARDQFRAVASGRMYSRERCKMLKTRRLRHYDTNKLFEQSVDLFLDMVARDGETVSVDFWDPQTMARVLLRWLFFGMEYEGKILEPILRPYLSNLFNGLHENAWLAEAWRKRREMYLSEMQSLSSFCELVTSGKMSPARGILSSLSNGWYWAESVIKTMERSGGRTRLILVRHEKAIGYDLTFPENKGLGAFSTWSKARGVGSVARQRRIGRRACKLFDFSTDTDGTGDGKETKGFAGHAELRDASPLTYVVSICRSRIRHRGPGDLVAAMISLRKFRILQEAAVVLPRVERVALLDTVQRAARESSRLSKKRSHVDEADDHSFRQLYTPRSESNLLDSPTRSSPRSHEHRIIAEHQRQLELEIQEIHDTLGRSARPRQRPSLWDSYSVSSWTSSVDSAPEAVAFRKYRTSISDGISIPGSSLMRDSLRVDRNHARNKFGEMISREESPTWNTVENRRMLDDDFDSMDADRLPSWDTLEVTLNKKLCNYENAKKEHSVEE